MANEQEPQTELVFVPLGGVGEIGMNLALYGYGPRRPRANGSSSIAASPFPGRELPGVDLVLPDIRFLEENAGRPARASSSPMRMRITTARCSTSGRGSRCQSMTPFTAGLLEAKRAVRAGRAEIPVTIYRAGDKFTVGPFAIEADQRRALDPRADVAGDHARRPAPSSTPATGRSIRDPALGPPTDEARFRALGDAGVLALICDSTNAHARRRSPVARRRSAQSLRKHHRGGARAGWPSPPSPPMSAASARSPRPRRDAGREVLVLGRSMKRDHRCRRASSATWRACRRSSHEDEYRLIPRDKLVVLCTGSQGEPRAALAKLARNEMKTLALSPGDTVIFSSRAIPGNEKAILEIKNLLIDQGIKVIEDGDALVHVSGHPRRNELRKMYEWTRPQIGVPVHGEAAHLVAQGSLMAASGIKEVAQVRDGDMLRLCAGRGRDHRPGAVRPHLQGRQADRRRRGDGHPRSPQAVLCRPRRGQCRARRQIRDRRRSRPRRDRRAAADASGEPLEELMLDAAIGAIESIPRQRRKDLGAGVGSGAARGARRRQRGLGQEAASSRFS